VRRVPVELSLIRRICGAAPPGTPSLALGEPSHPVLPAVRAALLEAARGELRYGPNAGDVAVRRALAARRIGDGGDERSVLLTAGAQEALAVATLGLAGPGDEVVVPELAYPAYESLALLTGARVVRAPETDPEAGISSHTRLVVVGSPSNPTGRVAAPGMLERLARRAARGGFHLLVDEVYAEICPAGATTPAPAAARVLRVGSLSKIAGAPGLRAGWLLGDPDLLGELLPVHQYLVTAASRLAQAAIAGWCATGASELREVWAFYDQRRRLLSRRLAAVRGLRWREPEGGFFLFVDVRAAVGDATAELALELARRGEVVVVPGEAFGPGGAGFLRLSFAGAAVDIDEAAGRLARALERRRVA